VCLAKTSCCEIAGATNAEILRENGLGSKRTKSQRSNSNWSKGLSRLPRSAPSAGAAARPYRNNTPAAIPPARKLPHSPELPPFHREHVVQRILARWRAIDLSYLLTGGQEEELRGHPSIRHEELTAMTNGTRAALSVLAIPALLVALTAGTSAQQRRAAPGAVLPSLYDLKTTTLLGKSADLSAYRGKVTLVVNVASYCGFTPQYTGLEKLHRELSGKAFSVLGFPSNDFGEQEPGSPQEILEFCKRTYDVTFPMFAKVVTKPGPDQSPIYKFLSGIGHLPAWNFAKYVVGKDGRVVAFFPSEVTPDAAELRGAIDNALAAK